MTSQTSRGNKRMLTGRVVSNKADKTVVVLCESILQHPLYKKYIQRKKKFMAHDPENSCALGDKVQIIESRPISKRKKWCLRKILEKAQ